MFAVNPARRVEVIKIGVEGTPLICIDEFFTEPARLVDDAMRAAFINVGSRYPGVRAPAPPACADAMLGATAALIESVYGAPPARELDLCAYSMVTTAPERLRAIQRIPHFDGPETDRLAFLHYLCAPFQGGTSFYRHRATGLAVVTPDRVAEYRDCAVAEIKASESMPGYVTDHTRHFERIHTVEAAFNRLIVYKGNALHSGDVTPRTVLSEDPRCGRLTVNGFGVMRS